MTATPTSGWLAATWTGFKAPGVSLVKKPPPPPRPVSLVKANHLRQPRGADLLYSPNFARPPVPRFPKEASDAPSVHQAA